LTERNIFCINKIQEGNGLDWRWLWIHICGLHGTEFGMKEVDAYGFGLKDSSFKLAE
jgi:hypothetical protein